MSIDNKQRTEIENGYFASKHRRDYPVNYKLRKMRDYSPYDYKSTKQ